MKKFLKWVGIVLGALAGLIVIGLVGIYFASQSRLSHAFEIPEERVVIPMDAASIGNGKHIFQ